MIVLDEEIDDPDLAKRIGIWYAGKVIAIKTLRPQTVIKDDSIAMLLRTISEPTFVTINVSDFWRVIPVSPHYSIICVDLPTRQSDEVPNWLRRCFRLPDFKTKAARVGKIICLRPSRIDYYESDGQLKTLAWPE